MSSFAPPPASWWHPRFCERHGVFAHVAPVVRAFDGFTSFPPVAAWNLAPWPVRNARGVPLRFVPQGPKPTRRARRGSPIDPGALYDERIFTAGEVPSREGSWHDLFNMLAWRVFPRTKAAINARQRAALVGWLAPGARVLPGARTSEQDALAMLDEGGLVLLCSADPDRTLVALTRGDDPRPLIARGALAPFVLGHALLEHLLDGWPPLRACAVAVHAPGHGGHDALPDSHERRLALADEALAARLEAGAFVGGTGLALDRRLFEP